MIQISGGQWKGRSLHIPAGSETRPTSNKVRQALFNSLQMVTEDARVLDLFAGSGGIGLEALSRGAREAVFVDQSRAATQVIRKNVGILGCSAQIEIQEMAVRKYLKEGAIASKFDLIFADPPYALEPSQWGLWETNWKTILNPDGLLIVEWGKKANREIPEKSGMICCREKTYGDTVLSHYRCNDEAQGEENVI